MNPHIKWSLNTKPLSLSFCQLACWWWSDPFQNNFSPLTAFPGLLGVEVVSRAHSEYTMLSAKMGVAAEIWRADTPAQPCH